MFTRIFMGLAVLLVSGCATTSKLDSKTYNALTLCNAGSNISMSASLEAKIAENIRNGVSFKAGLDDEIRGVLLGGPGVTPETIVAVQAKYDECLDRELSR